MPRLRFFSLNESVLQVIAAVMVGVGLGLVFVLTSGMSQTWRGLLFLSMPALTALMIVNHPEKTLVGPKKTLLGLILLAVPLNLDFSLVIVVPPDYKVALNELRLSIATATLIFGYASLLLTRQYGQSRPSKIRFFPATSIPALGLIMATIASTFYSVNLKLSLFLIVQLCELFLLYLFVANYIQTYDDLRFILTVVALLLLAEAAFIVFQKFTGFTFSLGGITASIQGTRVAGTLDSPNNAGAFLETTLPIAFSALLLARNRLGKRLAALAFLVGTIALIAPMSRSAWAGFLLAMTVFVGWGLRKGWVNFATVGMMLLVFAIVVVLFYGQIVERLTGDDQGSAESRRVLNTLAWNMIQDKPVLGVGANTFTLWSDHYESPETGPLGWLARAPVHNKYFLVWAETGTVGLFFWLWFLLAALKRGVQSANSDDKVKGITALGFSCGLLAISYHLTSDHLLNRSITLLLWLVVAVLTSLYELPPQQEPAKDKPEGNPDKAWA